MGLRFDYYYSCNLQILKVIFRISMFLSGSWCSGSHEWSLLRLFWWAGPHFSWRADDLLWQLWNGVRNSCSLIGHPPPFFLPKWINKSLTNVEEGWFSIWRLLSARVRVANLEKGCMLIFGIITVPFHFKQVCSIYVYSLKFMLRFLWYSFLSRCNGGFPIAAWWVLIEGL